MAYKYACMATSCCRDNEENFNNPVYTGDNTKAATTQPSNGDEHIYDTIKCDDVDIKERKPKNTVSSNVYQNFSASANKNQDCSTIKSDQVSFSESKMCHTSTKTTKKTHRDGPKPPTKPKSANAPKVAPVNKSHHQMPTNEDPSLEDEYILPDPKYNLRKNNEYASLDKTQQTESNQYTSLAIPQSTPYQELVSRSSAPSKYTVPGRLPTTN